MAAGQYGENVQVSRAQQAFDIPGCVSTLTRKEGTAAGK